MVGTLRMGNMIEGGNDKVLLLTSLFKIPRSNTCHKCMHYICSAGLDESDLYNMVRNHRRIE